MEYGGSSYGSLFYVMDLWSCGLVKEFMEMESRRKQRFMRMPLKGDRMAGSYAREHSA
jgi:hypothetical protein